MSGYGWQGSPINVKIGELRNSKSPHDRSCPLSPCSLHDSGDKDNSRTKEERYLLIPVSTYIGITLTKALVPAEEGS